MKKIKMNKIIENFDDVQKIHQKKKKIIENFDGVEKLDENYRKFRWCRRNVSKN